MKSPSRPADEALRLETLRGYDLLDTLPERSLDDLTALAAHICEAPISLITLVDEHRQWFKSKLGVSLSETPRDDSFCGHAILQQDLFVVPDATKDERFSDNPLVTGEPRIRFYAGASLLTASGQALGSLCVIDHVPRQLSQTQLEALRVLSRQVMSQLELRRQTRSMLESERIFSTLISNLPGMAYRCLNDAEWTMTFVSDGCKAVTGYERSEMEGNRSVSYGDLVHPDDRDWLWKKCQASLEARTPCNNEYRIVAKTGETRWVWERARGIYGADGGLLSIEGFVQDVTVRRLAEQEGSRLLSITRATLESTADGILVVSSGGRIETFNRNFARMWRLPDDLLAARDDARALQCVLDQLADPGQFMEKVTYLYAHPEDKSFDTLAFKDGRCFERYSQPQVVDGQVLGRVWSFRDISERKQAEAALRASEERFKHALDATRDGLWDWDIRSGQVYFSPQWIRLLGYAPADVPPRVEFFFSVLHPDDAGRVQQIVEEHLAGRTSVKQDEIRLRMKSGEYRWFYDRGQVVTRDDDGRPLRMVGTITDITEQKKNQRRINTYARLAHELNDSTTKTDASQLIAEAADALIGWDAAVLVMYDERTGLCRSALNMDLVDGIRAAVSPDTGRWPPTPRMQRTMEHGAELILRHSSTDCLEGYQTFGNKARRSASLMFVPIRDGRKTVGMLSIQSYKTDAYERADLDTLQSLADYCGGALSRILDREALAESERRLREAQSIARIGNFHWNTKTNRVIWSEELFRIYGHQPGQFEPSLESYLDAVHPDDRPRVLQTLQTALAVNGKFDHDYRILFPDGSVRWVHARGVATTDEDGNSSGMEGTCQDVTERRQMEEQLRQTQKMEAIGQLAGGVAHDFNNILAAILGNAELALADTNPEDPARESLMEIKAATARAKNLVQQILAFSRQQPQERRVIALSPVVQETANFLRAIIPTVVELVTTIDTAAPPVLADPTQIHRVLVNLCTNAWHALDDEAGRIEIKLESITLSSTGADRLAGLRPGRFACLSVSDTGKGLAPGILGRIFDPFFTTKGPGKGTGLGLSVVHGIVHEHDGAVTVASQPGMGATFQIYLPAAAASEDPLPTLTSSTLRGDGQRILYLDDEEPLVSIATRMLERLGYQVAGFTRPVDALTAFRESPERFDLIITDLNMPGSSGLHVAIEFLKLRPDVPIVLSSGRVTDDLRQSARIAGIRDVLHKPNTIAEFTEAIHRLTAKPRQP